MKKILSLFIATVMSVAVCSQTIIPEGDISGTWTLSGSPYQITGTTTVPDGSTLTIEAGVTVEWQGSYTMWIEGRILAMGTAADTVLFTAADPLVGFRSIRFDTTNSANDTSRFEYCIFEYGNVYGDFPDNCGGAIAIVSYSKIIIDHCLFRNNKAIEPDVFPMKSSGGAIAVAISSPQIRNCTFINNEAYVGGAIIYATESNPILVNNLFMDNMAIGSGYGEGYGGAVLCYDLSNGEIRNNIFNGNDAENGGGGIAVIDNCSPSIHHNLFYDNSAYWGGAIEVQDTCWPQITNNTIADNNASIGAGIHLLDALHTDVRNTILWGNSVTQIHLNSASDTIYVYYSDVMGGEVLVGGSGYVGEWEECMDEDPLFRDPANVDYHLSWASFPVVDETRSPCIDEGYGFTADPDLTVLDMGAFYYDQMPETPVAYDPSEWTTSSFIADWSPCFGALGYILDVAYDEEFIYIVPGYDTLHIMDTASWYDVTGLEYGRLYYFRVKACNTACTGTYSNTVEVDVLTSVDELIDKPVRIYSVDNNLILNLQDKIILKSSVMIYNSMGQLIASRQLTGGTTIIPVNISKQVIVVKVLLNGKSYHAKVMLN